MKRCIFAFVIPFLTALSCASAPPPVAEPAPEPAPAPVETPVPKAPAAEEPPASPSVTETEEVFDRTTISEEVFITTKADIQQLVENLNGIIRAGNYNSWLTYLGDDYRKKINSKEFLDDIVARYPVFRGRIKTSRDYFRNVVVPSRANDHVDDIEFVSNNEVKAYSLDSKGQTVVLYYLENLDGNWKIAN